MGVNEIIQIGNTIRELRTQKGYTQKQMSELTGIPYSTYSNYENNNREPNKEQLQKIADVLNVSISELLGTASGYYLNDETAKLAQKMFEDPDMRSLFDMKRNMPPERFKAHMEFMKNLYEQEKGES